jgi:hypothetical protein
MEEPGNSVGMAMRYGLVGRCRFPAGVRDCSLLHSVQTSSVAHPVSYSIGTEDFYPDQNWPERKAGHSPPSSAEVKNGGVIPPFPIPFHAVVLN